MNWWRRLTFCICLQVISSDLPFSNVYDCRTNALRLIKQNYTALSGNPSSELGHVGVSTTICLLFSNPCQFFCSTDANGIKPHHYKLVFVRRTVFHAHSGFLRRGLGVLQSKWCMCSGGRHTQTHGTTVLEFESPLMMPDDEEITSKNIGVIRVRGITQRLLQTIWLKNIEALVCWHKQLTII